MTLILAHDIGTTGDKATLLGHDGTLVASAFSPYVTTYPRPGWCEQEPSDWWGAVVNTTRAILAAPEVDPADIAAVGFSGHMMACVPVGGDGQPLSRAMIHSDTRSAGIAEEISGRFGREIYECTGNPADSHYPAPKIAWLAQNEPEMYRRTRWFLQSKDWIAGRFTGRFGLTDYSDASLYGAFDISRRCWSSDMCEAWAIESSKLPEVVPASTVIGRVTRDASAATGLPEGIPVVIGGGDGAAAAVGAGAVAVGDAYNYLGSTSWVASITDHAVIDPGQRLFVLANMDATTYSLLGAIQAAGTAFQWAADTLGVPETELADRDGLNRYALLDELAASARAGSSGLIFLPYLLGERSPIWDPKARGVFFGLGPEHGRAHLVRAVLEGVAYALRSVIDAIEENRVQVAGLAMIGGGASSRLWAQILADVFGRPVSVPAYPREATSYGAAMAAGIGVGIYKDYAAARSLIKWRQEVARSVDAGVYDGLYNLFRGLYPALKKSFATLSDYRG